MIEIRSEFCPQNHPCPVMRICPEGAISQQGYGAPIIDHEKCTGCRKCSRACSTFEWVENAKAV
ncbi:MAG: 4Fe-4S ferredoxin [Spirochaetes bacterium GWF1_51_8]|nr:MAG: 4Fe-4S ferredoxin [Spirochaetes bacterium GWF1_51_8]